MEVQPVKQLRAVQMVEFGSLVRLTGFAFVAGVLPYKVGVHCMMGSHGENIPHQDDTVIVREQCFLQTYEFHSKIKWLEIALS